MIEKSLKLKKYLMFLFFPKCLSIVIGLPRTRSVDPSQRLPSARVVSNNVFWRRFGMTPVSAVFSTFLTHHGQFIDHDIIATPSETGMPCPLLSLLTVRVYTL